MANYISQHTGVQIDNGVAKANSAVQPSDLTTAIANKQDNLVSGTNIKSLNSTTLLGTGNIDINKTTLGLNNVDNTADLVKPISTDTQTALSGKAASVHNHVTSDVTGLDTALNAKVDKEAGKGLSSSDYTDTEKTKLSGIADNANNYTHPASHPASVITQDASNRFVTDAEKATWNAYATGTGTVTGVSGTAPIVSSGGTAPVISISAATTLAAGSMSATDKTKLDGVAEGANAYTHPVTHPASVIEQDENNRLVTDAEKAAWTAKQAALVSGTTLKTVNGQSLLGEGDLPIGASGDWADITGKPAVIAAGADAATARTVIGLGSVDNTSDAGKPVSTAQQTALNFKVDTVAGKGLSTEDYSTAEKSKLAGVATGATANATDADLRDRSTHTGAQAINTVTALQSALDAKQSTLVSGTNIKTINGASILGSGDMALGAGAALTCTYTGILDMPIVQLPGASEMVLASPTGKERSYGLLFSRANYRLTGLDFPNLEFIGGDFNPRRHGCIDQSEPSSTPTTIGGNFSPTTMGALTNLSLPALTTVGGTFNPSYMAALTSLSLPEPLTTVGGNFNPSNMDALTSLSVPALTTVGGTFNPRQHGCIDQPERTSTHDCREHLQPLQHGCTYQFERTSLDNCGEPPQPHQHGCTNQLEPSCHRGHRRYCQLR